MRKKDLHSKSHLMNCFLHFKRNKKININFDFCLGELATVESGTTSTAVTTPTANGECIIITKKLGTPRECYDTNK